MNDEILIIDIQGFSDDPGNLIPKEVAWILLSGAAEMHAIIDPPCPWNNLSPKSQILNDYLTKEKLGITWAQTGISHDSIGPLCTHIPAKISTIYTYNYQTRTVLHLFEHQKIIFLCERIPQLNFLDIKKENCRFHQQSPRKYTCARTNVRHMREYLLETLPPSPEDTPPELCMPENGNFLGVESPGFRAIEPRILSYFTWYSKNKTSTELCDAGFFYTGRNDEVQCYACGVKISLWLPGDEPHRRHLEANSQCFLFTNNPQQKVIILRDYLSRK